mmetsp:Transcript_27304/g.81571  ORF Transcript_27304/g.81571 Transcript_27304/m.81571 type:complete len:230 (+) Transcript_27304:706-1395(+)
MAVADGVRPVGPAAAEQAQPGRPAVEQELGKAEDALVAQLAERRPSEEAVLDDRRARAMLPAQQRAHFGRRGPEVLVAELERPRQRLRLEHGVRAAQRRGAQDDLLVPSGPRHLVSGPPLVRHPDHDACAQALGEPLGRGRLAPRRAVRGGSPRRGHDAGPSARSRRGDARLEDGEREHVVEEAKRRLGVLYPLHPETQLLGQTAKPVQLVPAGRVPSAVGKPAPLADL